LGNLKFKIDCQKAGNFSYGLAKVLLKGIWGFIDTSGKFIILPIYAEVQDFENNLAKVKDDQFSWFQIEKSGRKQNLIYEADASGYRVYTKNGLKGMLDLQGNTIVNPLALELGFFGEKYATFCIKKRFGLYYQKGNRLAEDSFLNIGIDPGDFIKLESLEEIKYLK